MEIKILKNLVSRYRKERTLDNWILLENLMPDKILCKDCGGSIFYPGSSLIRLSKDGILKYAKDSTNAGTYKEIRHNKYFLKVCQNCLIDKFPSYSVMNKSRVFNTMNKITKYAFSIPDNIARIATDNIALTLKKLIKLYGKKEGLKRWEKYRKLQAETNTFEYKKKKYGWTEEDFKKFNKSRAVTLKNMIKKHGEIKGTEIFNNYVEKQRVNGKKLGWFIEKYGRINGKEKYKLISLGKAKGGAKSKVSVSKVSQEFFKKLDVYLSPYFKTQYSDKGDEKIIYIDAIDKLYMCDYYIEELDVCVEFNGDYYHANPKKYNSNHIFTEFNSKQVNEITANDLWEKDRLRIENLKKYEGIKTIVVWEDDYYKNKDNPEFYDIIIKLCTEQK